MKMAAAMVALISMSAMADIPGPGPRPARPEPKPVEEQPRMVISVAVRPDNAAELIIPRKLLGANAPKAEKAEAPILPTIMIGTALAAAVTLGGLAISRRRTAGRTVTAVALLGVILASAGVGIANAPAPKRPDPVNVPVTIRVVEEGDAAQLVLSPDVVANLNRRGR